MDVVARNEIGKFGVLRRDADTVEECKKLAVLMAQIVIEERWIDRARIGVEMFDQLDRITTAAFRAGRRDLAEQLGHRLKEDDESWQTQQNTKLGS